MAQPRSVVAAFAAPVQFFVLNVTGAGNGQGTVTSSPSGITRALSAGMGTGTCAASFGQGQGVTLHATPSPGQAFAGWSGACSGSGTCTVTMSQARAVTASFSAATQQYVVGVLGAGSGQGTVVSSPAGLNCSINAGSTSGTCSAFFSSGQMVTLSAVPVSGHVFAGWSGTVHGLGACQLVVDQGKVVTAAFTAPAQAPLLSVTASGAGSGRVTSAPGGIDCTMTAGTTAGTCQAAFGQGGTVSLTAVPVAGHTFAGWSGACSGTGACSVIMMGNRQVGAGFTPPTACTPELVTAPSETATDVNLGANGPTWTFQTTGFVQNTASCSMAWSASSNQSWLSVSPSSGTVAGNAWVPITITVNLTNLQAGVTYSGTLTFVAPGASGSPSTYTYRLTVHP